MKFALLGEDPAVLPLLAAIADAPDHTLSCVVAGTPLLEQARTHSPAVSVVPQWENLLATKAIDVVIVAGSTPNVLEGAKRLAASGMSLVIFPSIEQGAEWAYELALIREDGGARLLPIFPDSHHPAVCQLRKQIAAGVVGTVRYLQLERTVHTAAEQQTLALLAPEVIETVLLEDLDLLRSVGGDYSQVTALYSGETSGSVLRASVTLAGDHLPESTWSLESSTSVPIWRLTVIGESGRLVLEGESDRWESVRLTTEDGATPVLTDETAAAESALMTDNGRILLEQFTASPQSQAHSADWIDLIRVWDILDGVRRSLRRRRTIDLYFETTSERSLFKTRMTAVGCSLLMVTLLAVVMLLIAGVMLDHRDAVEVRAQAADFIIHRDEFRGSSARLTAGGEAHLQRIAGKMPVTRTEVLIESSGSGETELDHERQQMVIETLRDHDAPEADRRTLIAELKGTGVQRFMRIARIAVFAPLFLFLLLQALLFAARPSSRGPNSSSSGDHEPTK